MMKTRIAEGPLAVTDAASLLAAGELVAVPTETVYGLAADALNPTACAKIFEAKQRPLSDPLIVHIPDRDHLSALAISTPLAERLAEAFWPGPLTLVLQRQAVIPDIVTAGQETVAIRMSAHPILQSILKFLNKPVAAPSANRFGRISPTNSSHVLEELGGRIPLIVEGGPCRHGIESTIVHVDGDSMQILREGPVTAKMLSEHGRIVDHSGNIASPGNLKSHYAPSTPLRMVRFDVAALNQDHRQVGEPPRWHADALWHWHPANDPKKRIGLLAWQDPKDGFDVIEILSPSGNSVEAATNLYSAMRRLDGADLDLIVAEFPPEGGLGAAITDRLKKAAARRD